MATQLIEGIELLSGPGNQNRLRGRLSLPSDFDAKRYAAKWALKGHGVSAAREKQTLSFASCTAAGWEVYKSNGKMVTRVLGRDVYILMVRPKALQETVTKMFGNLSRRRISAEAKGETVLGGTPNDDPGILRNDDLSRTMGKEGVEDVNLPEHKINPPKGAGSAKAKSIGVRKKIIQ